MIDSEWIEAVCDMQTAGTSAAAPVIAIEKLDGCAYPGVDLTPFKQAARALKLRIDRLRADAKIAMAEGFSIFQIEALTREMRNVQRLAQHERDAMKDAIMEQP